MEPVGRVHREIVRPKLQSLKHLFNPTRKFKSVQCTDKVCHSPLSFPAAGAIRPQNNFRKRNHKNSAQHDESRYTGRATTQFTAGVENSQKNSRTLRINRKYTDYTNLKSMISTRNIRLNQNEKRANCQTKKLQAPTRRASARSESALLTDEGTTHDPSRYPCAPYTIRQSAKRYMPLSQFNFHLYNMNSSCTAIA